MDKVQEKYKTYPISRGWGTAYFFFGIPACWSIGWLIARLVVHIQGVSSFEGANGFAVAFQTPAWALVLFILLWIGFFELRRYQNAIAGATVVFGICSIPAFSLLATLL
jgi:hypothetical protein